MKRSDYRPVMIEWDDAMSEDDWQAHRKVRNKPMRSVTVGMLVREDDVAVTVAGIVNRHHVGCCTTIPRAMIARLTDLREVRL